MVQVPHRQSASPVPGKQVQSLLGLSNSDQRGRDSRLHQRTLCRCGNSLAYRASPTAGAQRTVNPLPKCKDLRSSAMPLCQVTEDQWPGATGADCAM
jgi:hypothetical protein